MIAADPLKLKPKFDNAVFSEAIAALATDVKIVAAIILVENFIGVAPHRVVYLFCLITR